MNRHAAARFPGIRQGKNLSTRFDKPADPAKLQTAGSILLPLRLPTRSLAWEPACWLLAGCEETAVVAMIDYNRAPHPGTVSIVNRSDTRTLRCMDFPVDTIAAAVDSGIVYLHNEKMGHVIDARSGTPIKKIPVH